MSYTITHPYIIINCYIPPDYYSCSYHAVFSSDDIAVKLRIFGKASAFATNGGNWPGNDIEDSALPAKMEIDYVRYYIKKDIL